MSHPKLNWAMARFVLDLAEMDELIDAAHAALDDGFYSYSLGELASQYVPSSEISEKLFASSVKELGLKLPGQAASVEMMLEADAIEVFEGRIVSDQLLERIREDYDKLFVFGRERGNSLQESIREWVNYYYVFDQYREYGYLNTSRDTFSEDDPEYIALLQAFVLFSRNWILDRNRPFLQPHWRTSTVLGLAASIREERAFDRLPILADALQDAGCEMGDVLDHLRLIRNHTHSCWVVELLLSDLPNS
jgi:hypothetical protein